MICRLGIHWYPKWEVSTRWVDSCYGVVPIGNVHTPHPIQERTCKLCGKIVMRKVGTYL